MGKTLAIIIGTVVASVVLGIAVVATVMYLTAEPEEFSRGKVFYAPLLIQPAVC